MRLVAVLAIIAALAAPATASAKGMRGKVCGAAGCVPAGRAVLESFTADTGPFPLVYAVARPRYLALTLTSPHARWTFHYVPAKQLLRIGRSWRPAPAAFADALRPYVARLGLLP